MLNNSLTYPLNIILNLIKKINNTLILINNSLSLFTLT